MKAFTLAHVKNLRRNDVILTGDAYSGYEPRAREVENITADPEHEGFFIVSFFSRIRKVKLYGEEQVIAVIAT